MIPNGEYRMTSKELDVVRMKGGTIAVITRMEILCGGNVKEVTLQPLTGIFHRFFLYWTGRLRVAEDDINTLVKVGQLCA